MKNVFYPLALVSGLLILQSHPVDARSCDRPTVRSGITFHFSTTRPSYGHRYYPRHYTVPRYQSYYHTPKRIIRHRPTYHFSQSGYLHRGTVFRVQKTLRHRGYGCGPVDGIFGYQTKRALRQFQYDAGLHPTGRINRSTLRCLGISY